MQWMHIRSPMHVSACTFAALAYRMTEYTTYMSSFVRLSTYRRGPLHACKCKRVNVSHGKVHRVLKQAHCRLVAARETFFYISLLLLSYPAVLPSLFFCLVRCTVPYATRVYNGKCSFSVSSIREPNEQ